MIHSKGDLILDLKNDFCYMLVLVQLKMLTAA